MALQGPCSCPWNDGDRRPPSDDRRGVCVSCLTWCRCVVSIIAVRLCYMRVELLFCCRTQNRSLFFPLFFLRWKPALGRKQAVTSTSSPPSPYPLPTLSLPLPTLSPPFPYPLPTHSQPNTSNTPRTVHRFAVASVQPAIPSRLHPDHAARIATRRRS